MDDLEREPALRRLGRAFSFQYNLILFFGAFLYSAALASWLPALLAMAGEIVWLMIGSTSGVSRSIGKRSVETSAAPTNAMEATALEDLPAYALRFDALAHVCSNVRRIRLDTTGVSLAELGSTIAHLDETQRSFVRLASLHQRLSQFLTHMPTGELEGEVQRRSEALSREKDLAVRMALRQSLGLVQRRLQHRELTANMLRAVELRMAAIEQSFFYIESHVLPLGSALELKAEVEALVARVSSVDTLEAGASDAIASAGGSSSISYPAPVVFDSD